MNRIIHLASKLILLLLVPLLFVNETALAEYSIDRIDPIGKDLGINANYGQFRNRYGSYRAHDGIDYRTRDSRGNTFQDIHPITSGTAHIHPADNAGWGRYVDVDHGGYYTRYTHLDSVKVSEGQWVTTTTTLGVSGKTNGGVNDKMGPHLHFGLGSPNAVTANTVNPILAGLKQPFYGKLNIIEDLADYRKIKLLGAGTDGTFDGENEVLQIVEPGKPIRAIIEAYHASNKNQYSNPYKIVLEVENTTDHSWPKKTKEIVFDNMTNILANFDTDDGYYCFARPCVTHAFSESNYADYYFVKIYPSEGIYRITAKIYSCYRDDSGFHLSDPETATRIITVGLVGLDFNAAGYSYAWLPDDIAGDKGIMVAAAGGGGGMRVSSVSGDTGPPEIFYAYANNKFITSNLLNVDANLQQNALIESRTKNKSDWTITFYNDPDHNHKYEELNIANQDWLRAEWGNGKAAGIYSFSVTAKDRESGLVSTMEASDLITIDNTRPSALITMISNSVALPEETITAQIVPSEDLYSLMVNVVKNSDYSLVQQRVASIPSLKKNEAMLIEWNDAYSYPDDYYRLEIIMTDLAGNISRVYPPIVSVDKGGYYPAPPTGEVYSLELPEPPSWEVRPKVTDVDFDSSGNMYVLFGQTAKVVKYDPGGKEIKTVKTFSDIPMVCPLGISAANDRLYIADSYNLRIIICDSSLNLIKEVKGRTAYMIEGDVDCYSWILGVKNGGHSGDAGGGKNWPLGETFGLPEDVSVANNYSYVVDRYSNRALKYDLDGNTEKFSGLKADLKDQARAKYNINSGISGQTVDKAEFYSNSLNDDIYFDNSSVMETHYNGDKIWAKEMYLHNNPASDGDGRLKSPQSLFAGFSDFLYVADTGNNRIQVFNADGSYRAKYGEGILSQPKGIDVDGLGNIYVADTGNHRIVKFSPTGEFIKEYRSEDGEITPLKIKIKGSKIYIADANSNRPLVWDIGGEIKSFGCSAKISPNGDGNGDSALIGYELTEPGKVTLTLHNSAKEEIGQLYTYPASQPSYSLVSDSLRERGVHNEFWSGLIKTASQEMVNVSDITPDGEYIIKATVSFGDYQKSQEAKIIIDGRPPQVDISADKGYLSPNGDGINDSAKLTMVVTDYSPTVDAYLLAYRNGRLIDSLWQEKVLPTGVERNYLWNGKIDGLIYDGNYSFVLRAIDDCGNLGTGSCEVFVDSQPPLIDDFQIENPVFSPNGDGRKDQMTASFKLREEGSGLATVEAEIIDENGFSFSLPAYSLSLTAYSFSWGEVVPDGKYWLKVAATDKSGNQAVRTASLEVDTIPPVIANATAEPNPFTPNDDGVKDTTTFKCHFSEPVKSNIAIYDGEGKLFRELYPPDGNYLSIPWNGQGEHGEVIGGNYNYNIYAEDPAGNLATSEAGLIVVDREPSLVKYAYGENDPFSPAIEQGRILYALSRDNLKISVAVIGKDKQVVKTLVDGALKNKGEYSVSWDGGYSASYVGPHSSRDDNKVPDGAYQIKITAYDEYNLASGEASFNLAVDATPPYLTLQPVSVDYSAKKAFLNFYLPEKSRVAVKVFNADGDLLTTLATEDNDPGQRQIVYGLEDGQAGSGRYFEIIAEDSAKNQDNKQSEMFLIVPSPVTISGLGAEPGTFTPNGDGHTDSTRLSYILSGGVPPYHVTVNILNPLGTIYQQLADNEIEWPGKWMFSWMPSSPLKPLPPDGYYQCQIEVTDSIGAKVAGLGNILAVSTSPTVDLTLGSPVFSPNDDGTLDKLDFNYTFNYATFYQPEPGQVKFEVLSTNGEILWEKGFTQYAGSYIYQYDGTDKYGQKLTAGNYYIRMSGTDSLGSPAIYKTLSFAIDYTNPDPSDFAVTPAYAKTGTEVVIDLQFSEELAGDPTVQLKMSDGVVRVAGLKSKNGSVYQYNYLVAGDENEGTTDVLVNAVDNAGNAVNKSASFVLDKTSPAISEVAISPDPVSTASVCGGLSVKFKVGESLQNARVNVTQANGPKLLAVTGGDWSTAGSLCEAKYEPYSGADGTAAISIETTDLAGNQTLLARSVTVDTTNPQFDRISSAVAGNAENYAKASESVTISFFASEALPLNPTVKVNDNNCAYLSASADHEYTYRYDVSASDIEGPAVITIDGRDAAGNEGFAQANSTAESFTIDLQNPTVGIAEPGSADIIASPSPFYTNADPLDTGDRPNYTTLRYSISEDGYVTLKVHRVPNDQTTYAAGDFREDNRAATIVDDVLQYQGTHNVQWRGESATLDSNGDGFADPGKYAFIVEVRDRAGNLTQKKWGGTVWIQNNVLEVVQPATIGINPDPLYFSPAGNSPVVSTKIWFEINLSVTPEGVAAPERIEAMGLSSKRVGTYTIRVYDNAANLVRTIVKDISAYSVSPEAVIWDGRVGTGVDKLAAGDPTVDGEYKLSVEVKDFAGNPAGGSPFERWVTVDSTLPIITDNQSGNDTWTNSSGTLYDVDFSDNGSKLSNVSYQIKRPNGSYSDWLPLTAVATGSAGHTDNWPVDWSNCAEGVNYVSVKATDRAGNETSLTDVFYIKKDTATPGTCTAPSPPRTPYNQLRPVWSWTPVSDATSGVRGYYIKIGTTAGGDDVVPATYVGDVTSWTTNRDLWSGADFYASLQVEDNAGNLSNWGNSGLVKIDTQPPVISGISDNGPFSPGASLGSDDTITFNYSVSERCDTYIYVDDIIIHNWIGSGAYSYTWNPTGGVSEGAHTYRIYAIDDADNPVNSSNYSFVVDNTLPIINGVSFQHRAIIPDGTLTSMMITPSISDATSTSAAIKSGSTTIKSFSNVSGGFSWDGRNSGGALVQPGRFDVEIYASDNAGNSATYVKEKGLRVKSRDEIVFVDDNSSANDDIRTVKFAAGAGSYSSSYFTTSRDWISHPALGDFTGEGKSLLAVHQIDGDDKLVFYNPRLTDPNGTGNQFSITDNNDYSLAAGDFDGDGADELAVAGPSNFVGIYKYNTGLITSFSICGGRIAAGDIDGDGYEEIVAINENKIYLHYPRSASPGTGYILNTPNNLWNVACGDYDGDGVDDIFVTAIQNYGGPIKTNYIYVYDQSGTLLNQISFVDASPFPYITAGDFNGDGKSEVAVVTDSSGDTWMKVFNPITKQKFCEGVVANRCWHMSAEDADCSYGAGISSVSLPKTNAIATLEAPSLIAPTNDRQDVQNIRPSFEWFHHKADTTDYRIEVAKNDSFTIDHQTFSKSAGTGTQDKADSELYYYNYAIHEFDPGLERNTDYFWKVTALSPVSAATSEAWSFRVQPELTLVGVTNYPNPFNPNREQTKIRYRLSADADEVKIRIYDLTGSLVTELDGTTNGEGTSVWQKYNDVSWDGRNGRGDLVVNGIYPFEITARIGDRTVIGRGKIAVLK